MAKGRFITYTIPSFIRSTLNSYAQIFFSDSRLFAVILLGVSFFDAWAGISGLVAVIVSNGTAFLMGINRTSILKGHYGFNSLLAGLGLGVFYQPGTEYFILLAFSSLLILFLTLWMEGALGRYGLPFLSLSFLAGIWMVSLASRQFTALRVSERGIFMMNEMYSLGGPGMVKSYQWFGTLGLPEPVRIYFTSLGAIFFQYHLFAGILIAAGLLIHSRIAFLLSLTGFFSAYAYYQFIGADIRELSYSYIGFNYILTAIAIGGFFIIPSRWSFLWVILITPLISIILTSTQAIFGLFQLSVYSLPFNLAVLLFLYGLKFRERRTDQPQLVFYQQDSPEKNLYAHLNHRDRFGRATHIPVTLPFWGEWKVTQGHNGKITHQGEWRHAFDFEITDDEGVRFADSGTRREDYYAFGKPVISPADGTVEEVLDGIDDNEIGRVDLENNWGNTVVIRHGDQVYSKLSHLKNGSIRVAAGDTVKKGQLIASCGNSGRSPVPHLHFQLQATPYIGSKTIDYPLSHFIRNRTGLYDLRSWTTPEEEVVVSNITHNHSLEKAFHFIPGQELRFRVRKNDGKESDVLWEVEADALNHVFIRCRTSGSRAWITYDGDIHYFTHFEGDRSSLLFLFYLGAYKVMAGFYPELSVHDRFPANTFVSPWLAVIQDFFAPFFLFTRPEYTLKYVAMDDALLQTQIRLHSEVQVRMAGIELRKMRCDFHVGPSGLQKFVIRENDQWTEAIQATES